MKININSTIIFIIIVLMISNKSYSQDDFDKWLKKENETINIFISQEDKAFSSFLEKEWKEFELTQGFILDSKPKPQNIPKVEKQEDIEIEKEFKNLPPVSIPELKIEDKPRLNVVKDKKPQFEKINKVPASFKKIDFDFYGNNQSIKIPNIFKEKLHGKLDNKSISNYWSKLSSEITETVIIQIEDSIKKMQLNDWGSLIYLNQLALAIHVSDRNEQHLLVWYLLNHLGYKTKVCYSNEVVYLVVPSKNKIFSISMLGGDVSDEKKYIFDLTELSHRVKGKIYTYEGDYPKSNKLIEMEINLPIQINNIENQKELSFRYQAENFKVQFIYDPGNIKFFKEYPYTDLDVYFNSSIYTPTKNSLLNSLKQIIKDKSAPIAANILLRFVQTAFRYKTDDLNFGREKPLFAEETLFYSDSDCEDRAVLFAFLIKNLLGLDVIGLDYPGHVATAVKFNVPVPGDNLVYKGKTYTICDPTYINAYIGMAMPQVKGLQLENIIEMK
jgi:uncharacterized protein YehS (DUF1456 family)